MCGLRVEIALDFFFETAGTVAREQNDFVAENFRERVEKIFGGLFRLGENNFLAGKIFVIAQKIYQSVKFRVGGDFIPTSAQIFQDF